ncbi:nicotinamide mononucleotide transporter [Algoriella xinjiangensis]|uniref:Nicotinamide riboside transporter PnuC n=1 Tax=Algoriella xinjiangensis TaxID=684065 RepID=A0A1I4VAG7_9FLAO|nr:nicotinamide riboside transporter PnuC [Algoriella xinjiangensis]SFM98159.1 nicotinamide mononucleotide transporter [Algoriella xinjiangensis]VDH17066.1 Nicotinamide riboside transporter pnuC [Algoriella xinjiangensis]
MNNFIDYIVEPYKSYSTLQIILEIIAAFFGVLSVYYTKKRNILVYPTGILSTFLYIYLFFSWGLYGETLINLYYTSMSVYGWVLWSKQTEKDHLHVDVSWAKKTDYLKSLGLFFGTFIFILVLYHFRPIIDGFKNIIEIDTLIWSYKPVDFIDATSTGIFLIGMWLMAKRKIDNWYFWILGDIIMIPLLIYKGYAISSFQYSIFLILAIQGLFEWKKSVK